MPVSDTVMVIEDPDDERFAQFRVSERGLASRADKRDDAGSGLFLAEGDLVVERALAAGCRATAALVASTHVPAVARELDCPVYSGGVEIRRAVSGLGVIQNVIALFERPARPTVADLGRHSERLVILEAVDNPANVGAVVRNAAGLGWDGLILDHTSADPLARRALRVAMGTTFSLPHARTPQLVDELKKLTDGPAGFRLLALTPDLDAVSLRDIDPSTPLAVMIGSERSGLTPQLMAMATPVRIPMSEGIDSLNAAAAAAIACWQLAPSTRGG